MNVGDLVQPRFEHRHRLYPFVSNDGVELYTTVLLVSLSPLAVASLNFKYIWLVNEYVVLDPVARRADLLIIAGCIHKWEQYKREHNLCTNE